LKIKPKIFNNFFYIDGVCGFFPDQYSSFGGISAFERLVEANNLDNVFAMCLNATHGGVLSLGGTDSSLYTGQLQYTPFIDSFLFSIIIETISINKQQMIIPDSITTVVDSGTNIWLLSELYFQNLVSLFQKQLCPGFSVPGVCGSPSLFTGTCYKYTQAQISQLPAIEVTLNKGINLNIPASFYLVNNQTSPYYCFGVSNTGVGGLNIIGDLIMQGYYTVFDVGNQQMGWAPVNGENCFQGSQS